MDNYILDLEFPVNSAPVDRFSDNLVQKNLDLTYYLNVLCYWKFTVSSPLPY